MISHILPYSAAYLHTSSTLYIHTVGGHSERRRRQAGKVDIDLTSCGKARRVLLLPARLGRIVGSAYTYTTLHPATQPRFRVSDDVSILVHRGDLLQLQYVETG